jgi:hypothetical protein
MLTEHRTIHGNKIISMEIDNIEMLATIAGPT